MDWLEVAIVVSPVLGIGLLVAVLIGRSGRSAGPAIKGEGDPGPGMPPTPPMAPGAPTVQGTPVTELLLPEDLQFHLYRELGNGRKIHAIKLVRQHTRLGLKEAKDIVEALEAGWRPSPTQQLPRPAADDGGSLSDRVRAFERAGDHTAAIALVRSQTGMTAEEAERFVAALG